MKRRHLNLRKFKSQKAFKKLSRVYWNPIPVEIACRSTAPHNLQFCWKGGNKNFYG